MPLHDGFGRAKRSRRADLVWLERRDDSPQFVGRNAPAHQNNIGKRPGILARIQFRDLGVNRLDVWTLRQRVKNIPESVYSGMLYKIAANRTKVVITVEESLD